MKIPGTIFACDWTRFIPKIRAFRDRKQNLRVTNSTPLQRIRIRMWGN